MRGCVRTHQVRSNALWQDLHFKSTFLPFAHHVCCNDLHNTKYQKLYKMLVINAAKSLTNISKGGSNKQYLTPIRWPTRRLLKVVESIHLFHLNKNCHRWTILCLVHGISTDRTTFNRTCGCRIDRFSYTQSIQPPDYGIHLLR
jgi:hypothetical protein